MLGLTFKDTRSNASPTHAARHSSSPLPRRVQSKTAVGEQMPLQKKTREKEREKKEGRREGGREERRSSLLLKTCHCKDIMIYAVFFRIWSQINESKCES